MSFARLLAAFPSATIVDPGDETVVDGVLGTVEATIATGVDLWIVDLVGDDVEVDPSGRGRIDARVLATRTLEIGWIVRLADGRAYVIVGRGAHRRTPDGLHHRTYPARRL